MLPYGKNRKFRKNFTDCHPKGLGKNKGWGNRIRNWWEVELGGVDKGAERQRAKAEIRKELDNGT